MKILTKKDVKEIRELIEDLIMELDSQAYASELEVNHNRECIKEKDPNYYMICLEADHEFNIKSTRETMERLKRLRDLF